jgi:hypothetical protein
LDTIPEQDEYSGDEESKHGSVDERASGTASVRSIMSQEYLRR